MNTPGERLKVVMKHYRHTQTSLGQLVGVTKGYMSMMMSGKEPISAKVLDGLIKCLPELNIHWLLTGEGSMTMKIEPVEVPPIWSEIDMDDVERLRLAVLDQYHPEPSLTLGQDLVFRQACYRVLVDNPGQPWAALVVGGGVYLRIIQANPGVIIPVDLVGKSE
jgi:transcriptional regulator with XRE-family HTH domain